MASYSDDFNRADNSTSLGTDWGEVNGDWRIVSNTARQFSSAGAYYYSYYSAGAMASGNYYSQATIVGTNTGAAPGVSVRGATGAVTFYGYIFFASDFSYMVEITAGGEGILATGGSYTAAASVVARITANGTALTGTRGGSADISTTDGSLSNGVPGLCTYNDMDGAGDNMDTWSAADLVASTSMYPWKADRSFYGLIVQ